jgi:hypothetical protein
MKIGLLAAAVLFLGACGAPPFPGTQVTGTVSGHVLGWPCAPVEIVGSPCPGRPMSGARIEFTRAGAGVAATAVSDAAGAYSVTLPPGTYGVAVKSVRLVKGPTQVTVMPGLVTNADFIFDTGIR